MLADEGLHGLFPGNEGGGGHVIHGFQLALQGLGLFLRISIVNESQDLVFAFHLLQVGVGIDGHQGKGAHDQQAGHGDADGRKGHEAVAEHVGQALMEEVAEIMLTHGCALPHSRLRCR